MSEQVFINCTNGGPIRVHVKDGKIIRVRPLTFDDTDAASWSLNVKGRELRPPRKAGVAAFSLTEKSRVYSKDRILYPMKRKDFNPNVAFQGKAPLWSAHVEPAQFLFATEEAYRDVELIVDAPDEPGPPGVFNVNIRQGGVPTGGVTIIVTRGG